MSEGGFLLSFSTYSWVFHLFKKRGSEERQNSGRVWSCIHGRCERGINQKTKRGVHFRFSSRRFLRARWEKLSVSSRRTERGEKSGMKMKFFGDSSESREKYYIAYILFPWTLGDRETFSNSFLWKFSPLCRWISRTLFRVAILSSSVVWYNAF